MSIGRASGTVEPQVSDELFSYEENEFQQVSGNAVVDFTGNNGVDMPASGSIRHILWEVEAANGRLDRNHVAELVGIIPRYHTLTMATQANAGTTPGEITAELEVFWPKEADFGQVYDPNREVLSSDADADSYQVFSGNARPDGGTLWFDTAVLSTAFNDTVNGTGGGAQYSGGGLPQEMLNFRHQFGRGPIFEDGDEVRATSTMQYTQVENERVRQKNRFTLVWDVFEVERRELQEVR